MISEDFLEAIALKRVSEERGLRDLLQTLFCSEKNDHQLQKFKEKPLDQTGDEQKELIIRQRVM